MNRRNYLFIKIVAVLDKSGINSELDIAFATFLFKIFFEASLLWMNQLGKQLPVVLQVHQAI